MVLCDHTLAHKQPKREQATYQSQCCQPLVAISLLPMLFLTFANVVSLLEMMEDIGDHMVAVLLIGACLAQAPDVDSVGAVCPPTPLQVVPEVPICICFH